MHRFEYFDTESAMFYRDIGKVVMNNNPLDIGVRRDLKRDLMEKYSITEIEAINILNGNHIQEYVHKYDRKSNKIEIDEDMHKQKMSLLQQEEEAANRRAMVDDGW